MDGDSEALRKFKRRLWWDTFWDFMWLVGFLFAVNGIIGLIRGM